VQGVASHHPRRTRGKAIFDCVGTGAAQSPPT
jgi:hypothetical protein